MLKLKLHILVTWGEELTHWKRPWCQARLKAGREGDGRGCDGWMDMSLSKLQELVMNRKAWHPAGPWGCKEWTLLSYWTEYFEFLLDRSFLNFWTSLNFDSVESVFSQVMFSNTADTCMVWNLRFWHCLSTFHRDQNITVKRGEANISSVIYVGKIGKLPILESFCVPDFLLFHQMFLLFCSSVLNYLLASCLKENMAS